MSAFDPKRTWRRNTIRARNIVSDTCLRVPRRFAGLAGEMSKSCRISEDQRNSAAFYFCAPNGVSIPKPIDLPQCADVILTAWTATMRANGPLECDLRG
jgi:hypothetical protein